MTACGLLVYGDECYLAPSQHIVEILLRNPKHSKMLYRPNKAGETPYNIDIAHKRAILGDIFGAREYRHLLPGARARGVESYQPEALPPRGSMTRLLPRSVISGSSGTRLC